MACLVRTTHVVRFGFDPEVHIEARCFGELDRLHDRGLGESVSLDTRNGIIERRNNVDPLLVGHLTITNCRVAIESLSISNERVGLGHVRTICPLDSPGGDDEERRVELGHAETLAIGTKDNALNPDGVEASRSIRWHGDRGWKRIPSVIVTA